MALPRHEFIYIRVCDSNALSKADAVVIFIPRSHRVYSVETRRFVRAIERVRRLDCAVKRRLALRLSPIVLYIYEGSIMNKPYALARLMNRGE